MKKTGESELGEQKLPEPSSLFRMRALKRSSKSAALYDENVVPEILNREIFAARLVDNLTLIPGNRPIAKLGTPSNSPDKRPLSIYTPNGTKLPRHKVFGFAITFAEKVPTSPGLLPFNLEDVDIEMIESLLQPAGPAGYEKIQEIEVTPELVKAAQLSNDKRGQDGIPDQATTMAGDGVSPKLASANHIAILMKVQATGLSLFEWLHLIMFFLLKRKAQDPNNLTGGTRAANTDMMIGEFSVTLAVALLKAGVRLRVEALELGCHFASKIRFTIITKHFALPFVFNALTTDPPALEDHDYVQGFLISLVSELNSVITPKCNRTLSFDSAPTVPVPKLQSHVFFKRPKPEVKKEIDAEKTVVLGL